MLKSAKESKEQNFIVSALLSAQAERVGVSCMQDWFHGSNGIEWNKQRKDKKKVFHANTTQMSM